MSLIKISKKGRAPSAAPTPVDVQRFQEGRRETSDLVAPGQIEFMHDYFTMDTQYCRVFAVANWPRQVSPGWLSRLYTVGRNIDISFHIAPLASSLAEEQMKRALTAGQSDQMSSGGRVADAYQQVQMQDITNLRIELAAGKERLLSVMLYYLVRADTIEELNVASAEVRQGLREVELDVRPLLFEQIDGLMSVLPFGSPALSRPRRNIPTRPLATVFPFGDAPFDATQGIYYGDDVNAGRMLIYDRFGPKAVNYNAIVLGRAGGGKSYTVKSELLQHMMAGTNIIVIDPENEYRYLATQLDGDVIHIGPSSKHHINPFELFRYETGDDDTETLTEKVIYIKALIDLITSEKTSSQVRSIITSAQRNVLDAHIKQVYASHKITADPATHNRKPPVLRELYDQLMADKTNPEAKAIGNLLHEYANGAYSNFFNEQTNVDLSNRFLVFDIQTTPPDVRPVVTSMITDYVWNSSRLDKRKRVFVIDELWQLLRHQQLADVVSGMYKRSRKYNLGITGISQDVADFLASDAGRAALSNSEIRVILSQKRGAPIDALRDGLGLSEPMLAVIENAGAGEGIMQLGTRTFHVQGALMPPKIHDLITTKPSERAAIDRAARG